MSVLRRDMPNIRAGLLRPCNVLIMEVFHNDDAKDDAGIISRAGHCGIIYLKYSTKVL